jgi:tetratricopeptide (TPR) repeat protein
MKYVVLLVALLVVVACNSPRTADQASPKPETMGFSGQPLYANPADSMAVIKHDSLVKALALKGPLTEDDFITIGRSQVAIGQFRGAVETYSGGLLRFPDSYRLLRHRGHRYINLRELDKAITDLNRAEELIRSQPDVYEFDAAGKPGPTYQHNIWYHIGLVHFLKRNFTAAAEAFEKSLATAYKGNDKAGASDWLYNCYMRAGMNDKAAAVAKPFTMEFDIEPKDYPYYRRLLLFNNVIQPSELVNEAKPGDSLTLNDMTKMYGLANYYLYHGDTAKAQSLYAKVLQANAWQGFAYASAELDIAK